MTLDLDDVLADWHCPAGEICARMVVGRDGAELLQLRVDLGVMQMFPDGPPDGSRNHALPSVLEYVRHAARLGVGRLTHADWDALERELYQTNYRRLALASLAEAALSRNDVEAGKTHLRRALRDIDSCLERIALAGETAESGFGPGALGLRPTLVFQQGRLTVQLRVLEERWEEAVEEAEAGAHRLDALLDELGLEEERREQDPGIRFLRGLAQRLRRDYGISRTLREQLEDALAREDFRTAARLRDELSRRGQD